MVTITYEHTKQNDFRVTIMESSTQRIEIYSKYDGKYYRVHRILTYNKGGQA